MDSSLYIFNYITTNDINGKQYVGMHITKDLSDGYLGGGHAFYYAVRKYNKSNFTREILCFCTDVSTAFYNEGIYIKEYNTTVPNGYNISPNGGMKGKGSVSESTKKKISQSLKGRKGKPSKYKGVPRSEETKQKCRIVNLGRKHSEEARKHMSECKKGNKAHLGKPHSDETKTKISNAMKGKNTYKRDEKTKENMRKAWVLRKMSKKSHLH